MTPGLDQLRLELRAHLEVMAALKPWCDPSNKESDYFLVAFTWSRKLALETAGRYAQALANDEGEFCLDLCRGHDRRTIDAYPRPPP